VTNLVEVPVGWPTPAAGWPDWLWSVPFDGSQYPGARKAAPIEAGANCQHYAYEVLALFGFTIDRLRSSQLWADTGTTTPVGAGELQTLDLVLFNATPDAYAAHVGVVMPAGQVLHLSREIGRPALWSFTDFSVRPRYASLLGGKRPARAPWGPPPRPGPTRAA